MDDYIKRKDALDVFSKHMFAGYRGNGKSFFSEIVMPTFYCAIEDLPSANVTEIKYGHWIKNDNGTYSCSLCQSWIPNEQYYYARYCLHCGADMRERREIE